MPPSKRWWCTTAAVIVDANQAFLEMFGYRRAEVSGLNALDLCAPESRETVIQRMASGATAPYQAVGLRRDGSKFLGQLRGGPIHYQGRNLRVVAIRDISEQRQLEAQVQLQQQLLSMNSLAAGVAHEINNPLTYVLGNLQIMSQLLDDLVARAATPPTVMTELRRCLDETLIGTERVRGIVSDLRRLSRPSGPEWVAVDLRTALESALRLAGNEIRHRARVVRRWADAPPVLGSELRLVQVFVNLLLNAAQAIDEGRAGANEVVVSLAGEARGWAVVEISDTGRGMTPEIHARIFEPFFTTRPGCGVGLGLSISRSIVTEMGGEISASTTPGRGSSFRVTLPPSSPPERARTPGATPAATRRLRVLIVDDEAAVGRTLGRLVAGEHHVDTVVSLAEAVAAHTRGHRWRPALRRGAVRSDDARGDGHGPACPRDGDRPRAGPTDAVHDRGRVHAGSRTVPGPARHPGDRQTDPPRSAAGGAGPRRRALTAKRPSCQLRFNRRRTAADHPEPLRDAARPTRADTTPARRQRAWRHRARPAGVLATFVLGAVLPSPPAVSPCCTSIDKMGPAPRVAGPGSGRC